MVNSELTTKQLKNGDKLYHYTNSTGLKGICRGKLLFVDCKTYDKPDDSDNAEMTRVLDILESILNENIRRSPTKQEILTAATEAVEIYKGTKKRPKNSNSSDKNKNIYIFCFCYREDDQTMYKDFNADYCIQFDYQSLVATMPSYLELIEGKVVYEESEQINILKESIEKWIFKEEALFRNINSWSDIKKANKEDLKNIKTRISSLVLDLSPFFKYRSHCNEHEYRFVYKLNKKYDDGEQKKIGRRAQFIDFGVLNALDKVLIAPKNEKGLNRKEIESILNKNKYKLIVKKSKHTKNKMLSKKLSKNNDFTDFEKINENSI